MATPKRNPIEDLRSMSIMNGFGMGLPEMDYGGMGANVGPMPMSNTGSQYEDLDPAYQASTPKWHSSIQTAPVRQSTGPQRSNNQPSVMDIFNQFTPQTVATDRFNDFIKNAPELNRPGIGRRLVASAAALGKGGIEDADKILYSPYAHQMADWKAKAEPYYQAANLERQGNINERQLIGQMSTAHINQQKADTSAYSAEIRRFKAENPNLEFDTKGPTVLVKDPATGQITDTGYPTGEMSEIEKINLENKGRLAAAEARGLDAQTLEMLRQMGREKTGGTTYQLPDGRVIRIRPDGQAEEVNIPGTGGKPPGVLAKPGTAPTNRPASANEVRGDRNNLMQEIYDQYPEYRKWMIPPDSPNGRWELKPPPTMGSWFATDTTDQKNIDDYNALKKLLYPSGTETKPSSSFSSVIGGSSSVGGRGAGPPPTSTGGRGSMPPSTPSNTGRGAGPTPPPTSPGVQPVIQHSPSTGRYRISYDGGKTWRDYNPNGKK